MNEEDKPSAPHWDRIAKAFLRPPAPPTRRQTEAFAARVMARLEPARQSRPSLIEALRWLAPALAFAAACGLFVFWPSPEQHPARALLTEGNGSYRLTALFEPNATADDILALAMEDI